MSVNPPPRILAIIPCYNEEEALGALLAEFQELPFSCDTLVIDDGSTDATYDIASQYSKVIHFTNNRGVPFAIKEGLGYALEHGYDYCVQIDGDGQHIPSQIDKLVAAIKKTSADIAIGSRYYPEFLPRSLAARRVAGFLFSMIIFLLFRRTWICDPFSGMRMMNKTAMAYFHDRLDNTFMDAAIVPQALKASFHVCETQVRMRPRISGTSHVSGIKGAVFFLRLLRIILRISFK